MSLGRSDTELDSIREPDIEVSKEGRQAARDEEDQLNQDSAKEAFKMRNLYSGELYVLLKNWAFAVFGLCVVTGLRAPTTVATCPAPIAWLYWATCFTILLFVSQQTRTWITRVLRDNVGFAYGAFVLLAIGWTVGAAECSSFVSTWKTWTPVDLAFAFELPSAVLVALAGTVTAGAVAMFVVVLKHYFTHPSRMR